MRFEFSEITREHALEYYFTSFLCGNFNFVFGETITCIWKEMWKVTKKLPTFNTKVQLKKIQRYLLTINQS